MARWLAKDAWLGAAARRRAARRRWRERQRVRVRRRTHSRCYLLCVQCRLTPIHRKATLCTASAGLADPVVAQRSACPLTSTLIQLQPVLGQTKPKGTIFGVLSQSGQSAAFPRLFAKQGKQIYLAPSCRPTFFGMRYLTALAFERVQVGQSVEPWRSAHEAHRLGATWATRRGRPGTVGSICWHGNVVLRMCNVAAISWLAN